MGKIREVSNLNRTQIKEQLYVAEGRLHSYLNAEQAILSGQSYEAEGLKLTRANLKDVQNMIASLKKEISALNARLKGRASFRIVTPGW